MTDGKQFPVNGTRVTRPVLGIVREGTHEPVECALGVARVAGGHFETFFRLGGERVLLLGDAEATLESHLRTAQVEKRKANRQQPPGAQA
ncbi:hypothetical protein L3Q67_00885 [Saccharothrix sp. AJ9571]|nr:hypothetical protein L3Q67_00885 [Saccharothrix sp. AJ9571]